MKNTPVAHEQHMIRIYCIPTEKELNSHQLIVKHYELYCKENGLNFNDDIKIQHTNSGKPYFENSDIHFSISHTSELTVISFAPFNIGIDCESTTRKIKHAMLIKEKIFSLREQAYATDTERFIEIWVKKEAYAKYTGKGLSDVRNFDTFSLSGKFDTVRKGEYIICTYHE